MRTSVSEDLLRQLSNPYRRHLLRYICVCSTLTEPTWDERTSVTVLCVGEGIVGMINSLRKASKLKPSITMTCDIRLAPPATVTEWFHLSNFTHKTWVNLWYGFESLSNYSARCDHLPKITSIYHFPEQSTIVKSKPGYHCRKPLGHYLIYNLKDSLFFS